MLLENSAVTTHDIYSVGGSLPWNSATYIHRQADVDLYQGLKARKFCTVLGPRQSGKSSLRVRTRYRLTQLGYRCATLYSTQLLDSPQDYYRWDKQLASSLWDSLYPNDAASLRHWLSQTNDLLPQQRLEHFARDMLLKAPHLPTPYLNKPDHTAPDTPAVSATAPPTVIFIDTAEALLDLPFLANDLFDWIWHCYCLRKVYPAYRNLNFVILGNALSDTLIQNKALRSAQRAIALPNFNLSDTTPLQAAFKPYVTAPEHVLEAIMRWTNGQPLLTQKLCALVKTSLDQFGKESRGQDSKGDESGKLSRPAAPFLETLNQWVDHVVQLHIIENWNRQDDLSYLWEMFYRITHSRYKKQILTTYQRILTDQPVPISHNQAQIELLHSGLVIEKNGHLHSANEIYRHIFTPLL